MAREIELTQGQVTIVDDDVYEWAKGFKWYAMQTGWGWYAYRYEGKRASRKQILLHREIMKAPDGVQVDHEDGNGLNNLSENLRLATNAENGRNRGPNANNKSGYKGVSWHKTGGKWQVHVMVDGENIYLGLFADIIEAAKAYDSAARKHHGKFAYQNFPEGEK